MPFIIDGYNVLRMVENLNEIENISQLHLCRLISSYLSFEGEFGEIVFDGTGPREKAGFDNIPFLQVTFSGPQLDADTLIELHIDASTAPRLLTVVSSDRRLRAAAAKRKAVAVKSDSFWKALSKFIKQSKRRKRYAEPTEKRQGLTESETEYWLKVFGLS